MRGQSDFLVGIGAYCFFCLNKIPGRIPQFKKEPESGLPIPTELSTHPTYSLHYFTRYLKMDMRRVFNTNESISPDLLAKVEGAKLKVELCQECGSRTERFSELCKQLEKIEMEIGFHMKLIQGKLTTTETTRLSHSSESSEFLGKLEIVNALRDEAAKRCSTKLNGIIAPLVKVQNQTTGQLSAERLKIKSSKRTNSFNKSQQSVSFFNFGFSSHNPNVDVKMETCSSPLNSFTDEGDDDDSDYGSPEDSNFDVDKVSSSPSLSTAVDVGQNTEIILTTPQSLINPKTGKHKCNICSKEFSQSGHFKRHYRAVHLKIRYRCSICSKDFSDADTHRQHLKMEHLGIRYKCNFCARAFKRKKYLQDHIRKTNCGN